MQKAYTNNDASEDDVSSKGNNQTENQSAPDTVAENVLPSESGGILGGKTEEKDSIDIIAEEPQKESTIESDPVRILQLSQAVLVPESLDDDEGSLIIPPTPVESGSIPFIIPSTPTEEKCEDKEKPLETEDGKEPSEVDKEDDVEKRKDVDATPPNLVPTRKSSESPDQSQNNFSIAETDFRNGESEDFTEVSFTEKDDKNREGNESKSEIDDWSLHLSASEATQSLQFVLDDEAEDEKQEEVEDGFSKEEDKISVPSSDVTPVKEKSVTESQLVEPEIEDGEAKKQDSELLSLNSSPSIEKPVFHIETPAISASAASEKSTAPIETATTVQSDVEDSKTSKADQSDGIQDSSDHEQDLPEEQAPKAEDSNSDDAKLKMPSLKTQTPESPVPEKKPEAEKEESLDTEKKKSPEVESEAVDSIEAEKEVVGDLDTTPLPPPPTTVSDNGNIAQVQNTEDLKLVEKGAEILDDRKTVLSQSTEKTESFVCSSQESPPAKLVFSFTDANSFLEQCDTHIGRKPSDPDSVLNTKPGETVDFMCAVFSKKDQKVYLTAYLMDELSKIPYFLGNTSPQTSSMSTSTSKKSLHHSSLMSGDLGDISSSLSSKSPPSSADFQHNSKYIQTLPPFESSQDASMLTIAELHEGSFITSTRKTPIKSKNIHDDRNNKTFVSKKLTDSSSSTEEARFVRPDNTSASKRSAGRKRRYTKDNPPDGSLLPASTTLPKASISLKRKNLTSSSSSSSKTPTGSHKKNVKNVKRSAKKKRKVNVLEEHVSYEACMDAEPVDAEEVLHLEEDPNLIPSDRILPGVRVMARWKDGYYYPGEVVSQENDACWKTRFDDGAAHIIPEVNMVKIAQLPKQCSVLVRSADDYFDPGIITGHYRDGQECGYIVEQDNGLTKRYPRASVILTSDQASLILGVKGSMVSPSTAAVSLDNIVSGKRKRTPVLAASASPALRTRLKRKAKNPDPNLQSTAESESVSDAVTPKASNKTNKRRTLITEESKDQSSKPQETEPSCDVSVEETKEETEKESSITGTGKRLFEGYAFLLSQTDEPPDESAILTLCLGEDLSGRFDKKHVSSLIEEEGGVVYDSFEECQKASSATNVYLLASIYLRTIKYMQCLASGIPCVRHTWITQSCNAGEVLGYHTYLLPAGFSIMEDKVLEWHGNTDALKDMKISLIAEKNKAFLDTWTPVLLAAKADLVQKSSLLSYTVKETSVIDIVVTDSSCPKKFLTAAERNRIPVVSSEWVIQCLICGFRIPPDAHPKFRHNYTE